MKRYIPPWRRSNASVPVVQDFDESEITIPQKYSPTLVGKQQWNQRAFEAKSRTKLILSRDCFDVQPGNEDRPVTIKIQGAKKDIEWAKFLIKDFVRNLDNPVVEVMTVPRASYRTLRRQKTLIRRETNCVAINFGNEHVDYAEAEPMRGVLVPYSPPMNLGDSFDIELSGTQERIQLAKSLFNYLLELNPTDVSNNQ